MNQNDKQLEQSETTWITAISLMLLYLIPYGIINHLPLERHTIPLFPFETMIPFMPWTFVIYISVFLQGLVVLSRLSKKVIRTILPAASGMIAFALVLFILFPIEYPRALYETSNPLILLFHMTDGPGNCFPSLHVAMTILLAYCYHFIEQDKRRRSIMWIWSILICISVLTTKQHYIVDVLGGIGIALPCIYLIHRRTQL